jgi:hypothetical protein
LPDGGSRENLAVEFTGPRGESGRFTAPAALEFAGATLDAEANTIAIEGTAAGKVYRLNGFIDKTEIRGSMKVGDTDGEIYLTNAFLKAIEHQQLAMWIRESPSPYAFAGILLLHTLGMSFVVGLSAGMDLRILGLARDLPLGPMRKFFPVLWFGFWLNAITGTLLLYADISTKLRNPDFWVKIVFIVFAVGSAVMMKRRVFGDSSIGDKPLGPDAKILAVASLFFWVGALTAGRLLAYVGPVSGLGD